jgi:hypothetical protein
MGFKMKGASAHDTSSKHGTNTNYQKSGAPGFLDNLMKGKGALGALNPLGAIGSRLGLFGKNKGGGGPPVAPNRNLPAPPPAEPAIATATTPAPALEAVPAVAEEAVPMTMKKKLKVGAPKLVGKQKNIDKNKNGKIDAGDFKAMKNGPTKKSNY